MKKHLLSFFTCILISSFAMAQQPAGENAGYLYKKEISGGLTLATNGWGLNFNYGKQLEAGKLLNFSLEYSILKHPKEIRVTSTSSFGGRGRSYKYGKVNYLFALRPKIGLKKLYFKKLRDEGVGIHGVVNVGPSFIFSRPAYVQLRKSDGTFPDQLYDPSIHVRNAVLGRSAWYVGYDELSIIPGGNINLGIQFEFSPLEESIKAIELGINADIYSKKVKIMWEDEGDFLFYNLYLRFLLGGKLN